MDLIEAMRARHSVRKYDDRPIEGEVLHEIKRVIDDCNQISGLNIQLCLGEPAAISGFLATYGRFRNVRNYVALVGKDEDSFEEKCGYYGERIVLEATRLGLSTCWVAGTYRKGKAAATVRDGEKLLMVIAIGYGAEAGSQHKTKPIEQLSSVRGDMPDWFRRGVEAAQLAPTAMNQQRFRFDLDDGLVKAVALPGPYVKTDLGIAKYHFELGAGEAGWRYA